jgi:hypothetical protein
MEGAGVFIGHTRRVTLHAWQCRLQPISDMRHGGGDERGGGISMANMELG